MKTQEENQIISFEAQDFPQLLKQISKPPKFIYVRSLRPFSSYFSRNLSIAVVGSRKSTAKSFQIAYQIGFSLRSFDNINLISGGAIGCDFAVHKGFLDAQLLSNFAYNFSATLVFAGGLSKLNPRRHVHFFEKIFGCGALFLSEKELYYEPKPYDFPIRNRIIAGLSDIVILIQASQKSGAMSTLQHALENHREIYVFDPLDIEDPNYAGNYSLLQAGAKSFSDVNTLIKACFNK